MDFVQNLFGGAKAAVSSVASADPDFADFATAASPAPASHSVASVFTAASSTPSSVFESFGSQFFGSPFGLHGRPFTKWYRVWERVTVHDFYQEMVLIPILLVIVLVNLWGARANASRAKRWADKHIPLLEAEYALVGFAKAPGVDDVQAQGLAKASTATGAPDEQLRQKAKHEYFTYASGRQNVAWLDVKLTLHKRFNPLISLLERGLSFFMESVDAPVERMEATAYCFDGKEKALLPQAASVGNSAYDGFVWAVVHKDKMQSLRNDRYDLSLTATRDHAKLPEWATTMSESAEVTDALLTPELIKAINEVGEDLEALIVSDQPIDAPKKLNELVPRKRIVLLTKLNPSASTALFSYFLRLPDVLVSSAHFRPEALRKIKATRDEEIRKIRKVDEEEKALERKETSDKLKKEERERKLKGMSAEEQKKFLERERNTDQKKGMKKRTMRA